mmetsp:Transcript_14813/g.42693  ORF Transcript_14813/g.42693 Transcript_14813/m.42693 type:complete len:249 (-) Transcript_14813:18-764(-)
MGTGEHLQPAELKLDALREASQSANLALGQPTATAILKAAAAFNRRREIHVQVLQPPAVLRNRARRLAIRLIQAEVRTEVPAVHLAIAGRSGDRRLRWHNCGLCVDTASLGDVAKAGLGELQQLPKLLATKRNVDGSPTSCEGVEQQHALYELGEVRGRGQAPKALHHRRRARPCKCDLAGPLPSQQTQRQDAGCRNIVGANAAAREECEKCARATASSNCCSACCPAKDCPVWVARGQRQVGQRQGQ